MVLSVLQHLVNPVTIEFITEYYMPPTNAAYLLQLAAISCSYKIFNSLLDNGM